MKAIVIASEHMGSCDWEFPPMLAEMYEMLPPHKQEELRKHLVDKIESHLGILATLAEFFAADNKLDVVKTSWNILNTQDRAMILRLEQLLKD